VAEEKFKEKQDTYATLINGRADEEIKANIVE